MPDKGALLFCKIAVAAKYITQEQANECLAAQDAQAQDGLSREIGEVLVEGGYLTKRQIELVLDAQRRTELRKMDKLFGKMAVDNEFAFATDVERCLELQKNEMRGKPPKVRPLGQIMKELGLLSAQQVQALLRAQGRLGKAPAGEQPSPTPASEVPHPPAVAAPPSPHTPPVLGARQRADTHAPLGAARIDSPQTHQALDSDGGYVLEEPDFASPREASVAAEPGLPRSDDVTPHLPRRGPPPLPRERTNEPAARSSTKGTSSESRVKTIIVPGFTKKQREAELAKVQSKYASRGWIFLGYDDGLVGGQARFNVPIDEFRRMRRGKWVGCLIVLFIVAIVGSLVDKSDNSGPPATKYDLATQYVADVAVFVRGTFERDSYMTGSELEAWVQKESNKLKEKYGLSEEEFIHANQLAGKIAESIDLEAIDRGEEPKGYDKKTHDALEALLRSTSRK